MAAAALPAPPVEAAAGSPADGAPPPYPARCYRALAPAFMAAAAAARGVHAPSPAGRFHYCEVGCGSGLTLAVLAAANPRAHFTGVESDAEQVRAARALAGDCGLANLRILEADVMRLAPAALPRFDFMALHGVYSWVDQSARAAIVNLLASRLRPGGLAYVSYNAWPGWSSLLPVRDWLQARVRALHGPLAERVTRARDELLALREQGVPLFTDNPVAAAVVADLREAEPGYLVHEYLLPGWSALRFDEVAGAMRAAGLDFAGEAELLFSLILALVISWTACCPASATPPAPRRGPRRICCRRRRSATSCTTASSAATSTAAPTRPPGSMPRIPSTRCS